MIGGGNRLLAVVFCLFDLGHCRVAEGIAESYAKSDQRTQSQGSHVMG